MSGKGRAFPKGWWKRLLLGSLVLIFYGVAVFYYGQMQPEPSVPVFLSNYFPDGDQAEDILKIMEKTDQDRGICFFREGGMETLEEPEYGRSTVVMTGEMIGEASLYDWRLAGLLFPDRVGCVLDSVSAVKLFGTENAEGRWLRFQGKEYQVRKVIPWKQRLLLISPEDPDGSYNRVFVKKEDSEMGKTPEQILMSCGLSGTIVEGGFLSGIALMALVFFPAAVGWSLWKSARTEQKKYFFRQADYWIWTGALLLLGVTGGMILWNTFRIPGDWIPSRWSDFTFWSERFSSAAENIQRFLILPKTMIQSENIIFCVKSLFFSLGVFFLFIVIRQKMCYTVHSMYFSGEKKKENAV